MGYNIQKSNDPRSFMYYDGQYYINGTVIELTDTYISSNSFNGKRLWKYVRFDHQVNAGGEMSYFFCAVKIDMLSLRDMGMSRQDINEYALYFTIPALHIDTAIGKVVKAIVLEETDRNAVDSALFDMAGNSKSDFAYPGLIFAWLIYIVVLIGSLIFKQFYFIWIIATFIFFEWRRSMRK